MAYQDGDQARTGYGQRNDAAVVTGDAVVLDVQIAHLPMRAAGALIDIFVMFIGYLLGVLLWAATLSDFDPAFTGAVLLIFTVLVLVGYPVIFETATRGRSLGKMAMGLRVVSDDGGPERFRQALFRSLAGVVEIWMFFGGPAVICSLVSPRGKRIGDVFAGTVVITERGPKLTPPPLMPPSLAWWASSLQLSGLGSDQAELARQFLSRAPELDPRIRDQMAHRICADVVARISPAPPAGAPPHYILAAVLAERHRRELERLRPPPQAPPPMAPQSPYAAPAEPLTYPPLGSTPPVAAPPIASATPSPSPSSHESAGGFAPPM